MDGENNISQLTAEERAKLVRELGEYIVDIAERTDGDKKRVPVLPLMVRERACRIIEARKPELGLDGCERLRWYMGVIDGMLDREWIYFPTEESRDEGFRRAKRAAMEYSLWAQLYPGGEDTTKTYDSSWSSWLVNDANNTKWVARSLNDTRLFYRTEADAQRVADILKREGV